MSWHVLSSLSKDGVQSRISAMAADTLYLTAPTGGSELLCRLRTQFEAQLASMASTLLSPSLLQLVQAHRARYPSLPGSKDVQHLVCGLASGLLAKLATHPLDVAKKRVQVAGLARSTAYGERVALVATRSLRGCLADIYRREGFAGLYKGVAPSVLKAGPSAAITFAAYELFLRWLSVAQEARRSEAASGE